MKHNHIILFDGSFFRIFERLGKKVPYEAYNPANHLGLGVTVDECLKNSQVPIWDIEKNPRDVVFNE